MHEVGHLLYMAEMQTSEVTRLRIREFNKIKVGGGVRLLKCEACGRLTDHGIIVDRDVVEESAGGQFEKIGYERWTLCPDCSGTIMARTVEFTEEILKDIDKTLQ